MLLLLACAHTPSPPAVRADAPPPTVPLLDEAGLGALLTNPDQQTLVVNFWATWCGPCVAELGTLHGVAADHPEVRFVLVSVDTAQDHVVVERFVEEHDVVLPVLHLAVPDTTGSLRRRVPGWPDSIPYTLVLGPGGQARARLDGVVTADRLADALR